MPGTRPSGTFLLRFVEVWTTKPLCLWLSEYEGFFSKHSLILTSNLCALKMKKRTLTAIFFSNFLHKVSVILFKSKQSLPKKALMLYLVAHVTWERQSNRQTTCLCVESVKQLVQCCVWMSVCACERWWEKPICEANCMLMSIFGLLVRLESLCGFVWNTAPSLHWGRPLLHFVHTYTSMGWILCP